MGKVGFRRHDANGTEIYCTTETFTSLPENRSALPSSLSMNSTERRKKTVVSFCSIYTTRCCAPWELSSENNKKENLTVIYRISMTYPENFFLSPQPTAECSRVETHNSSETNGKLRNNCLNCIRSLHFTFTSISHFLPIFISLEKDFSCATAAVLLFLAWPNLLSLFSLSLFGCCRIRRKNDIKITHIFMRSAAYSSHLWGISFPFVRSLSHRSRLWLFKFVTFFESLICVYINIRPCVTQGASLFRETEGCSQLAWTLRDRETFSSNLLVIR